jgi:S1-C subfamily serine protease
VKWYTLAAEQGNVYAQNGLALALLHGRGTEKNPKEALRLLKSAVRNGLKGGYSETTIGWSYFTGKHAPAIPKNFAKSLYWNHLGSRAGHANAHSNLALHYFGGFGVEQNFSKMVYHLIKSVEFFDENLKWVTEEPDEWLDYRHMASSHFWNARVLYWKAISTGKRSYIYDLKKMNPEHEAERREQNRIAREQQEANTSGSGFFISKLGHVLTNQHVVSDCETVTVGDSADRQVTADVLDTDRRNDLALLRISSTKMASAETKFLISKLNIKVVPKASDGLMRLEDVELGEDVLVAGFPYADFFSSTIKVTTGIVSSTRGFGDDSGRFQIDAAVQPGSSGGPIYDENGNIVGVVVAQLNKMKFAEQLGSLPELVNFGIKASTVKQFLNTSGLPTNWSERSQLMSTRDLAKIAESQTVMVVCHR